MIFCDTCDNELCDYVLSLLHIALRLEADAELYRLMPTVPTERKDLAPLHLFTKMRDTNETHLMQKDVGNSLLDELFNQARLGSNSLLARLFLEPDAR